MKVTTSIILPSIRPQNLVRWYNAAKLASQNNSWEVVIVSPYDLPEELDRISNIKFLKSDRSQTVASQIGTLFCNSEFLYNCVDDGLLKEGAIDLAIDTWNKENLSDLDIINMRYREGVLDVNTLKPLPNISPELPIDYWRAYYHQLLRLSQIKSDWKISLHFFMKLTTYYNYGGYDCLFEYSSFAIHDLIFRLQKSGAKIIDLKKEAMWCSHLPGETGDHFAVHQSQEFHDWPIFKELYSNNYDRNINYNNWQNFDYKWARRFN